MPDNLLPVISIRSLHEVNCSECALHPVCLPPAVDETDLDQLESIIERRRTLPRGTPLFRQGDAFQSLYAVRSGAIKTCLTPPDGAEHITGFYLPGEIVGLDSLGRTHHGSSAMALESSTVCAIPFAQLETLALKLPGLQHHLFKLLSAEIHSDQQLLLLLGKRSAEARITAFLLAVATRHKRRQLSENHFHLPMSRTDIGNHLGLAIETVSRVLTRLQQTGVLEVDGKDIRILDRERLCQLAEPAAENTDGAGINVRKLS
ncbi:MAG: fumarate/nitrate reduction transcriptional regulator Fnr [bacterium]|nr:fumarate/nitrate reduction transcriptional regulator Fnr [bacterium]